MERRGSGMPKVAYSEGERERIREALIVTGLELFVKQGIQHTTVEQIYTRVGISRTFFYSFFPAKEDLVVQAFYRQQPKILEHARALMDDPDLSWREGVRQFLHDFCYAGESRFAIMTAEEQQALSKCLTGENRQAFMQKRLTFLTELLHILDVYTEEPAEKLIGNLVFALSILRRAIPDTLPFLFADAADETTNFQIDAILNYMESLRKR